MTIWTNSKPVVLFLRTLITLVGLAGCVLTSGIANGFFWRSLGIDIAAASESALNPEHWQTWVAISSVVQLLIFAGQFVALHLWRRDKDFIQLSHDTPSST
jgi:hypothetical protein